MKTYLKYILAPAAMGFALYSCNDLATPGSDTDESITQSVNEAEARIATDDPRLSSKECDFSMLRTVKKHENEKAIVMLAMRGAENEGHTYVLHVPELNQRYTACGLPEKMRHEGAVVVFSGEEKHVVPGERWVAVPMQITSVTLVTDNPGSGLEPVRDIRR